MPFPTKPMRKLELQGHGDEWGWLGGDPGLMAISFGTLGVILDRIRDPERLKQAR